MSKPIIIAGAGIAGLSAGLALANKGFDVSIFETASQPQEVGAGIQIAPNATKLLARWGVLDECRAVGVAPETLDLNDGKSGATRLHIPIKEIAERRWKSDYISIHRADLLMALFHAAQRHPRIDLQYGSEVVNEVWDDDGLRVTVGDQHLMTDLLVCCDGVWSKMRALQPEASRSAFSGFVAWRTTIAIEKLPTQLVRNTKKAQTITVWMGALNHVVSYPIQAGEAYNIVVITKGENPGKTWSKVGQKEGLLKHFAGWTPQLVNFLATIDDWTYWPLYAMQPVKFVQSERLVFLGDAAHSFLPFAAQGCAMALEDAATLAEVLSMSDLSRKQALSKFDQIRQHRLHAVSKRGNFNGFVYHAKGPVAFLRDLVMRVRPVESFMADLDWLYSYDAMAAAHL